MNIGKFTVQTFLIEESLSDIVEVFKFMECVPVQIDKGADALMYTALSKIFPEVDKGEEIPFYSIQITKDDSGKITEVKALQRSFPEYFILGKKIAEFK